jgi:PAS domain S-box-containing protein
MIFPNIIQAVYRINQTMNDQNSDNSQEFVSDSAIEPENSSSDAEKLAASRAESADLHRRLLRQESYFDAIFSSVSDFAYTFDRDGRFLFINQALLDLWGLKLEEAVGKNFFDLKYPDDLAARLQHQIEQVFETKRRVTDETLYESPTGVSGYYEYIFSPVFSPDGSVEMVAGTTRDITSRKEIERELKSIRSRLEVERARLAYIFEKAPAFVATLRGADHVFEITNPAYLQLIGHRDVIGKPVREALPEVEGQGFFELLDNVFQTGQAFTGREVAVDLQREPDAAPEKRIVDFVYQPILEADKSVSGIFVHGVDITELVAARRTANQANRLKDEFLATLSHELRTPLNSILGWSQIIKSRRLSEAEMENAVNVIAASARAQNQLIEDILDVSRIVTGKLRLSVRAVDLSEVTSAAIEAVRPAAEAKNIKLQAMLDPQAATFSGDPDRLQQVVWNLLSNAVKFTPQDGSVQIRLGRTDSNVEIAVTDTGKGIEPEFLPFVFDRFRQSDGSTTRRQGGLGLGLAIVRQIVELHGGTVSVTSAGEGKGANFTVALPRIPMQEESVAEISRINSDARNFPETKVISDVLTGMRILLVDDEADSRDLLKFVLDARGANVMTANSADEAVKLMGRGKYDILISDIGMPDEDGFSLIKRVRNLSDEEGGKIPAIALTAYARSEDRIKALQSGFQIHLSKPVDHLELIAVIANLAGQIKK